MDFLHEPRSKFIASPAGREKLTEHHGLSGTPYPSQISHRPDNLIEPRSKPNQITGFATVYHITCGKSLLVNQITVDSCL